MSAGELPGVVPVETFLATSPRVTIDLSAIYVYSDHCEFDVTWALRRTPEERNVWLEHAIDDVDYQFRGRYAGDPEFSRLHCIAQLADGRVLHDFGDGILGSTSMSHGEAGPVLEPLPPPGELRITLDWPEFGIHRVVTILNATAINQAARRFRRSGPYVDGRILTPRFGFDFSDGRSPAVRSREGGDPGLLPRGGYSGGQTELMLAPLPPPGEVRFWFAWPDLGVPETTTILDGTAIQQAAQRLQ